jgi:hypothetical protein
MTKQKINATLLEKAVYLHCTWCNVSFRNSFCMMQSSTRIQENFELIGIPENSNEGRLSGS